MEEAACLLYNLRENNPQKAIELARVPGPGPGEREAAAVVLVDCGDAVGDFASVSQGVEIFNELVESGGSDAALSYNLANALQVRARLAYGPVSPISGQAFEDRFRARVRFGEVLRDGIASPELKSQALTNIGILLLDTSRWVEGLDCFQRALEAQHIKKCGIQWDWPGSFTDSTRLIKPTVTLIRSSSVYVGSPTSCSQTRT